MKRWHSEVPLMLRRWKQEMEIHGYDWRNPPELSCVPSEQGVGSGKVCHCSAGIGALRWKKPLDCGRARCGICHSEKFYEPKRRGAKKRAAIEFDIYSEL